MDTMPAVARAGQRQRVIVVGAGFGGAYAAQHLCRNLPNRWEVVVIDRNNYLTFYPLLVEAGVGNLEPRHVVVPIRRFLGRDTQFIMAEVESVNLQGQQLQYRVVGDDRSESIHFDHLVLAPGSITRLPPVPGLKEHGFDVKSLADSISMRDRAIRLLELANTVEDRDERREILRVVVVGSNFTGIEFAGEYLDFLQEARRSYRNVQNDDIQVVLLEYADRILPAIDLDLAQFAQRHLQDRGMVIHTQNTVTEITATTATLKSGETLRTRTVVWCAGIAPAPLLDQIPGLPRDAKGYIVCEPTMRVQGWENVWAIGDSAAVPGPDAKPYAPTAQNASRQGPAVAANLIRTLKGEPLKPFEFKTLGSLAALGCRNAVAKIMGVKLSGFLAYFAFRAAYLSKMPSFSRKVRIALDWFLDMFFRRDVVQIGVQRLPTTLPPDTLPRPSEGAKVETPESRARLLK